MKNFVSLFVMLLVCIGCWIPVASAQQPDDSELVSVPDPELNFHIRNQVSKAHLPPDSITRGDIRSLLTFSPVGYWNKQVLDFTHAAEEGKIKDITGLEWATEAQVLVLDGNGVSDLAPVANLTNLEQLDVSGNNLRNIPPLGNLTKLTTLLISLNPNLGDNIAGLETLTALDHLAMSSIGVRDISPLQRLTNLTRLTVNGNQITDISPLQRLTNLKYLNAGDNQIADISPLRDLINLDILLIERNKIRDISPLQGLIELHHILLQGNQIRDLSSLEEWNEPTRFMLGFFDIFRIRFSEALTPEELKIADKTQTNPLSYPSIYEYLPSLMKRYPHRTDVFPASGLYHNLFRIQGGREVRTSNLNYIDRVPTTLEIVSGDGQTVGPGEALPVPLIVMVLDENGERFAGVPVTFEVTSGEGTVEPAMAVGVIPTDAFEDATEGEARTTFTAGTAIGPQTVVATVTHEGARVYDFINNEVVLREEREGATTLQTTFTINVQPGAIEAPTLATVDPPPYPQRCRWRGLHRRFPCKAMNCATGKRTARLGYM